MSSELYHMIEAISREKGIDPDVIIQALEEAYAAATRKYYRAKENYGSRFDRETGKFSVFAKHTVVEEDDLADPHTEITLGDARKIRPDAEVGTVIETPREHSEAPLTRIAAQAAKQVIYQKVKEAEREIVWNEYSDRIGDILTGTAKRFDRGDMLVDLGRAEGIIPRREQSRAEHYNPGDRVRAVLIHVERLGKGPQLILSRASELLVKKLFEMEVPEIYDGTVSIVGVARDPGERSKVAVASRDRDVDPVGACVGMKGSRVQAVIRELRGERIDIVQYDDDISQFVRHALNPAAINRVAIRDYETRDMEVIVPEDQLSLAIGRRGQNVRLASKLVGWNLDIKSELEKKAEMEAEMERMAQASRDLSSLPGIEDEIADLLLDAGFRAVEEVALASLEDLTSIEGISEDQAIEIHDAAEIRLPEMEREAAEAAEAAALAAEAEAEEEEEAPEAEDEETEAEPAGAEAEATEAVEDEVPETPETEEEEVPTSEAEAEAAGAEAGTDDAGANQVESDAPAESVNETGDGGSR